MKTLLSSFVFFASITVFSQPSFVRVQRTQLIDSTGKEIRLNAVNLGGWLLWEGWIIGAGFKSETDVKNNLLSLLGNEAYEDFLQAYYRHFITEKDIALMAKNGYNCVRVPFNHRLFAGQNPAYRDGYKLLDSLLVWCRRYGVYAVLDLHAAPGGQSGYFIADPSKRRLWESEENKKETVRLWQSLALRYKDNPVVAGYDLLNEPDTKATVLLSFYKDIIAAIRQVDRNHLLICEGNKLAHDFKDFPLPIDNNQIYSFHFYPWFDEGKKARALKDIVKDLPKGQPVWCGEWGEDKAENLMEIKSLLKGVPGICGTAFWTWKRVYENNDHVPLCTINTGKAWKRLSDWLNWKLFKPGNEEIQKGLSDFFNALAVELCTFNTSVNNVVSR